MPFQQLVSHSCPNVMVCMAGAPEKHHGQERVGFHGLPFLCLTNGGGRTSTNKWLWDRLSDLPIFWALSKPPGWFECQDYLWEAGSTEGGRPENIDVSALPLPDTAPPGPLPVVPELGDWLTPQKPVTDVGAAYFGVPGATGFMVSFDPQTGERTEKLIMRGDKPFEGWPF